MQTPNLSILAALSTLACAACASVASAQTTPPPAPTATTGETVQLSPFEVQSKKDYGYRATNSATATGSGEAIVNTPLSISILTSDFLKDKNITDLRDALRYVSGSSSDYQQIFSRGFPSVIKVDGSEVSDSGTGDYTTYNADRIEVIKGPVSVLQGRASAGGVVNIISRRPKFYASTDIEASYGSFDRKFGQFRTTGPLLDDKVAYLFSYTKLDRGDWVKYAHYNDDSMQFGLLLRPTRKLDVTLNFEEFRRDSYPQQHLTFTNPAFLAAEQEAERLYDAKGLPRPASYPQVNETTSAWLARTPGLGPNTPTEVVNVNLLMYPDGYRANIQGSQAYENRDRYTGFAEAKYSINDWMYWRSYFNRTQEIFHYARQSTFRPVANIGGLAISDKPQMGDVRGYRYDTIHELVTHFSTWGINHRTLTGFEYRKLSSRQILLNGKSVIYDPRSGADQQIVTNVLSANPAGFNYSLPFTVGTERSYYAVDQMTALNEMLHLFVGARRTESVQGSLVSKKLTPQYGIVTRVPHVDGLSLFATYGQSFRPNFIADGYGHIVPPTLEKNTEFGAKMDMLDSRVSGSVSMYRIDQTNVPLRDFATEAATGISPIYNVSGAARSRGVEADMIFTPIDNYQIVAGYSRIFEAETLAAQDVRQVGVRLNGAPTYTLNFWNKYTFTTGQLKGLYAGFGWRYVGAVHVHPSWSAPVYARNVSTVDLLVGYQWKIGRIGADVSLRVDNLTNRFFYDQSFRPNQGRSIDLITSLHF